MRSCKQIAANGESSAKIRSSRVEFAFRVSIDGSHFGWFFGLLFRSFVRSLSDERSLLHCICEFFALLFDVCCALFASAFSARFCECVCVFECGECLCARLAGWLCVF